MDKIKVCYSVLGQKYHKIVKDRNYAWSKCGSISSLFDRRQYHRFIIIDYNEDLDLKPCQRCFSK